MKLWGGGGEEASQEKQNDDKSDCFEKHHHEEHPGNPDSVGKKVKSEKHELVNNSKNEKG